MQRFRSNTSIIDTFDLPSTVTPDEITASLDAVFGTPQKEKVETFGIWLKERLFPGVVIKELNSYRYGDIQFTVTPRWADIPFELSRLPGGFLGELFRIGTVISLSAEKSSTAGENEEIRKSSIREYDTEPGKMLILADPAGNLPSATHEGNLLAEFLDSIGQKEYHHIGYGSKSKIITAIEKSGMIHYAGHSVYTGDKYTSGWQLEGEELLTLSDLEKLESSRQIPWFVFSNSCHAGNSGASGDLTGIAGAFLKIGVAQVIGPVKKIEDESACEFACSFYKNMFNGKEPAESLRVTRNEMQRKNPGSIVPHCYRLFGDPCFRVPGRKAEPQSHHGQTVYPVTSGYEGEKARKKILPLRVFLILLGCLIVVGIAFFVLSEKENDVIYIPPPAKNASW
jgi:hypothetical protein